MTSFLFRGFSLRQKIILLACGLVCLATLAVGLSGYLRVYDLTQQSVLQGLRSETRLMALEFSNAFNTMATDAHVLADTPPVSGILRAAAAGGTDPQDGSTLEGWKQRLQHIFVSVMRSRPYYTQIRYIGRGDQARELVRVNNAGGQPEVATDTDLQQKLGEPYVRAGLMLGPGEHYFSDITYNREHGKTDPAMMPVIRVVVPVYLRGVLKGLIVINADIRSLIGRVWEETMPDKDVFLISHGGVYAVRLAENGESHFSLGDEKEGAVPDIIGMLREHATGEPLITTGGGVAVTADTEIYNNNPGAFMTVALRIPEAKLMAGAVEVRDDTFRLIFGVMLLSLAVAAVVADRFTRPLRRLAAQVAGGMVPEHAWSGNADDEMVALARAVHEDMDDRERRSHAVLDSALDAIVTINARGIIQSTNPACVRLFGYEPEEMAGRNISMLMPEPYHGEHDGYLMAYRRTGRRKIIGVGREVEGKRKDGSVFPLDLAVSEFTHRGTMMFTGVMRDISERKQAQSAQEKLITRLQQTNEELDKFAYIASHDLKAPLRVIDNVTSWLEEDLHDMLDTQQLQDMQMLRGRVKRMEKMLEDLLEYSHIGKRMDHRFRETIPGNVLLGDVLQLLPPHEDFVVEVSEDFAGIELTRMPLRHIFLNLIGNAIKHHDKPSGRIVVSFTDVGGAWQFCVEDDGAGIEEQYYRKIFSMFQTLKPRDQVEGSGMGLAIVKKHVQQQGGIIWVESRPGEGSRFFFTWPKQISLPEEDSDNEAKEVA
jgi:PAS domain S-box-containing protein